MTEPAMLQADNGFLTSRRGGWRARAAAVVLAIVAIVAIVAIGGISGIGWSRHQAEQDAATVRTACYQVLVQLFAAATTDETPNAATPDGPPRQCATLSAQELTDVSTAALQEGFRRGAAVLDARHAVPSPSS